jgi:hypothetical protein
MPEPGDILLIRSPKRAFRLVRWMMASEHDHVVAVLNGGLTLNVVPPEVVLTPVERMLLPARIPALLRPVWPSEAARAAFVADLERLRGAPYDLYRGLSLVLRVFIKRMLGLRVALRAPRAEAPHVCSDTVLLGLERHLPGFGERIRTLPLDYVQLRCGTTEDFLAIARLCPDLLSRQPIQ